LLADLRRKYNFRPSGNENVLRFSDEPANSSDVARPKLVPKSRKGLVEKLRLLQQHRLDSLLPNQQQQLIELNGRPILTNQQPIEIEGPTGRFITTVSDIALADLGLDDSELGTVNMLMNLLDEPDEAPRGDVMCFDDFVLLHSGRGDSAMHGTRNAVRTVNVSTDNGFEVLAEYERLF
jgi:hypothetical protein